MINYLLTAIALNQKSPIFNNSGNNNQYRTNYNHNNTHINEHTYLKTGNLLSDTVKGCAASVIHTTEIQWY